MLLGTLGGSLLGNLLKGKAQLEQAGFLISPHPLTTFEVEKYYQKEPKFIGAFLKNHLPKINDGVYVRNLDEFKLVGTYWIDLNVNGNNIIYFNKFGVKHIPKETKN